MSETFADLLTCFICLETFKQPKDLPFLHTLCETCISTYIVSTVKDVKPKGFKCPVCRRHVPIGGSTEKPDTWAIILPGNHFVVSMIDRRAMNKAEKLCDACSSEKVTQTAISWCNICEEAYCDTCERNHKKYKMSRNHKILPIRDINEDSNISNIFAFVACNEHPDKTIEIYCKDQSKPCCTVCATVHHRKCEHVISIDKAVTGVKESTKGQELLKKCLVKMEEIIRKMPNLEKDLSKAIHSIKDIFDATDIISDTACFGRLHFKEKGPSLPKLKGVNFQTGKIKVRFTIDIKGLFINGIFFNDDILITDYERNRIVCQNHTGKETKVLKILYSPTDITKANDQTVDVSSEAKKIFIINVQPLTLLKTLYINIPLFGLSFVEDQYITANNNIIYWLNAETGAKIKELTTGAYNMFVSCFDKKFVHLYEWH